MLKARGSIKRTLDMGLTYVLVSLNASGHRKKYQTRFLVDTGATDTLAPVAELRKIGIKPVGKI